MDSGAPETVETVSSDCVERDDKKEEQSQDVHETQDTQDVHDDAQNSFDGMLHTLALARDTLLGHAEGSQVSGAISTAYHEASAALDRARGAVLEHYHKGTAEGQRVAERALADARDALGKAQAATSAAVHHTSADARAALENAQVALKKTSELVSGKVQTAFAWLSNGVWSVVDVAKEAAGTSVDYARSAAEATVHVAEEAVRGGVALAEHAVETVKKAVEGESEAPS